MIARGSLDWLFLPVLVTSQGKAERGKSKSLETHALIITTIANPKLDYGEQLIHSSTARYFRRH